MDGHVLLAEDNEDYRAILADALKLVGVRVSAFANGGELLDAILGDAAPPFVVVTDLMMPGVSGFDVCAELRQAGLLEVIPVVVVSALDTEEPGVTNLRKPVDLDRLLRVVEDLLAKAQKGAEPARIRLKRVRQQRAAASRHR